MPTANYFSYRSAASRYAAGRPYFHALIADQIREFLSLHQSLPRALDVGSGTGLSTFALKHLAREIVGIDASPVMIALAPSDTQISYVVSTAEQLPFDGDTFDLVTVSQAFHWMDRTSFLGEARRVLHANAWLVVYDDYFSSRMEQNDEFERWHREEYLLRFPSPQRPWAAFNDEDTAADGFQLLLHEQREHTLSFSLESLVDYFVTQSNVIDAVEAGGNDIYDVRKWLKDYLIPFFEKKKAANFLFSMPIWFLQRLP